jgi:hypothetical protein
MGDLENEDVVIDYNEIYEVNSDVSKLVEHEQFIGCVGKDVVDIDVSKLVEHEQFIGCVGKEAVDIDVTVNEETEASGNTC